MYHGLALAIRVTYLGELGWELHIPTDYALTVYDALFEAGAGSGHRARRARLALNSLRLEKAYRDYGLDIDNSDTLLDVGLELHRRLGQAGGFVGKDAMVAQRDSGVRTSRLVQVLVDDPEPLLYGTSSSTATGSTSARIENGAYGHTLGGASGSRCVEREEDITDDFIDSGSWELDIVGTRYPVTRVAHAAVRPEAGTDQGLGPRRVNA